MSSDSPERDIYTVSRLNQEVQALLEGGFPPLWVEGELSNLSRPSSGHLYFSLKDGGAQVPCALFRNRALHLRFKPRDGQHVLVRARVSLYVPQGRFQLIVEQMEEAGEGALRRAFEDLKRRLQAEGLFDPARKRPLPAFPRRVGVITSPTGAALRDVLSVLRRRFPLLPVLVYPVPVQGEGAAERIAATLRLASRRGDCDVLILTRGGGSLEDLQAFNEEVVARAVYDCEVPVVCGVGHEIDFSIADFVADVRAPTPSAAAELVSPDQVELMGRFWQSRRRLTERLKRQLREGGLALGGLLQRLRHQHPERRLRLQAQRVDELEHRLVLAMGHRMHREAMRLERLRMLLHRHSPAPRLDGLQARASELTHRLEQAMRRHLERLAARLASHARALNAVSPLATLDRGYSILTTADGQIVRDSSQVKTRQMVEARLARGGLRCRVVERRG